MEFGNWGLEAPNLMKLGFVILQSEWSCRNYGYKPQFHFNLNKNSSLRNFVVKLRLDNLNRHIVGILFQWKRSTWTIQLCV